VSANQLAPSAAGTVPPITNPKYRPPVVATVAGAPKRCIISTTSAASQGRSGRASRKRWRSAMAAALGATSRCGSPRRYSHDRSAATRSTSSLPRCGSREVFAGIVPPSRSTYPACVEALEPNCLLPIWMERSSSGNRSAADTRTPEGSGRAHFSLLTAVRRELGLPDFRPDRIPGHPVRRRLLKMPIMRPWDFSFRRPF
jgi:hypothetical protein